MDRFGLFAVIRLFTHRTVLNRKLDGFKGHMNTSKYARMAKCSQETALPDIKDLLDRSVLVQD